MHTERMVELFVLQTWQVALVGIAALVLFKAFARDRPHLAHTLWALVLLKCLIPPVVSSPIGIFTNASAETKSHNERPGGQASAADGSSQEIGHTSAATPQVEIRSAAAQLLTKSKHRNILVDWGTLLIAVWACGAGIAMFRMTRKLARFSREVRRQAVPTPRWMEEILQRQACLIGLKRVPQLAVVRGKLGPSVCGFLFPTIVIPESLIAPTACRRQAELRRELELLIAHELVHIRRGDLFFSAVQAVAVCCWWFHPAVRIASRGVSREAERSCDEETVASLNCAGVEYARVLLHAMQRRHDLYVPQPLPGIRPVDITASRMERVMKLKTGSRKCTPWWIPVLMVFGTLALLPNSEASLGQESSHIDKTIDGSVANGDEQAIEKVAPRGKSQWLNIDIRQLAVDPPQSYLVHEGDVLGITVEEVLGSASFPITVIDDGTISLPLLNPISVKGLTVAETRALVQQSYLESKIVASRCTVLVTVEQIHRRNVLVWRVDDDKPVQPQLVKLRGTDSDVLHAFSLSGGFPKGPVQSIRIIRAKNLLDGDLDELPARVRKGDVESELLVYRHAGRLELDDSVSASLHDGDLVLVLINKRASSK